MHWRALLPLLALLAAVPAASAGCASGWGGLPRRRRGHRNGSPWEDADDDSNAESDGGIRKRDTTANINEYFDNVVAQIKIFLAKNGFDPLVLPENYVYDLSFKGLLGHEWNTRLGLTGGEARNLTSLKRSGNATLKYNSAAREIELSADVVFPQIQVQYGYAAEVLDLGPAGYFRATVTDLVASIDVSVSLRNFTAELKDFRIKSARHIRVRVRGLGLLANLGAEAAANAFTDIFKRLILRVIEAKVREQVEQAVDASPPPALREADFSS